MAEQALARLDALDLLTKGDVDGFFVTLSAILRDYVERRFGVRAPEQTTAEFLAALGRRPGLTGHRDLLRSFLTLADGVKFAREQPEAADARAARQTVAEFVSATRADRAPTPAGAAA